jgi:hypothetical protein
MPVAVLAQVMPYAEFIEWLAFYKVRKKKLDK